MKMGPCSHLCKEEENKKKQTLSARIVEEGENEEAPDEIRLFGSCWRTRTVSQVGKNEKKSKCRSQEQKYPLDFYWVRHLAADMG